MAEKNGSFYDAFSTIKLLEQVLDYHDEYQTELTLILNDIKETMTEASTVPLEASDKPAISIEVIQKTSATKLIEKLDFAFTHECIGKYLNNLAEINNGSETDARFSGPFPLLCDPAGTRKNYSLMLQVTKEYINEAKTAVAEFDRDPSGWILREDIEILLQHLHYKDGEKKREQDGLKEAWKRAQSAKVALSGLDEMFDEFFEGRVKP